MNIHETDDCLVDGEHTLKINMRIYYELIKHWT